MPLSYIFWGIYILCFILGIWGNYSATEASWWRPVGSYLVLWILVGILGYHAFGSAVK